MIHFESFSPSCINQILGVKSNYPKVKSGLKNVSYVRILNQIQLTKPHLLTIGVKTTFGKTFSKIQKSKNIDFILVQKAQVNQMTAVLISSLLGRRFFWIQNFTNPPQPNFLVRLLLSQADRIIVESSKEATKLKSLGINKDKVKITKH